MNQAEKFKNRRLVTARTLLAATTAILLAAWGGHSVTSARPAADSESAAEAVEVGRSIFHREWLANDPRSVAGDGLGPVFNESSCVACHNMGGPGGAGSIEKNVALLSANRLAVVISGSGIVVGETDGGPNRLDDQTRALLAGIHPGFQEADTVVLHRFGIDRDAHRAWRMQAQNGVIVAQLQEKLPPPTVVAQPVEGLILTDELQVLEGQFLDTGSFIVSPDIQFIQAAGGVDAGQFPVISRVLEQINALKQDVHAINETSASVGTAALQSSQRNTSALFGIGLIDEIPDEVIEAIAERQRGAAAGVTGRVHRLEDGRIGRFGWKAQKASLYDFTMAACAVELGLDVPGHAQAPVPYHADYEAPGQDLNQEQVDALVAFLRVLPPPVQNDPEEDEARKRIEQGRELFKSAGCAVCHVEDMGDVEGLYSDLLLHDLGPELGGVGHYGVPTSPAPDSEEPLGLSDAGEPQRGIGPAATEWRTPPLWGCRDSVPYLHDGRARTLETAVAFHGGEAADSRLRYFALSVSDQQAVIAFLKTLTAPRITE